ncbi:hypothetical protein V2J09_015440 [Rumex salicifolius]
MRGLQFYPKSLTFSLLITILLLGSSFGLCSARRGRHWRHGSSLSASLYKKKGKSHSSHSSSHHASKPKGKAPTYNPPTPTLPPSQSPSPGQITPLPPPASQDPYKDSTSAFSVLDFGAKGDAISDDTKAFESAWAAACKLEASTMIVPSGYRFLVGPISFSGPYCMSNIVFQLDGEIIAPTSPKVWGSGLLWWIQFTKLKGITIQGEGIIDGSGSVWWQNSPYDPVDSESQLLVPLNNTVLEAPPMPVTSRLSQKMPSTKPTALRFYGSSNVTVTGITIQNSQQCHLKFDNCVGVTVHDMNVTSPADSPNTDGIHLQNSQLINIHHTNIACGDDCISIQTGCSNVYVHSINCGPGHGISIGSLGKDKTKACVSNVTVRDVLMSNTMTGVRIKTWQGGSGSVKNIMFSNIVMTEVQLPIVIDQYYCDKRTCQNQSDAVSVSGVTYERIRGTYTVKPVHLACSDELPCTDITLTAIQLRPQQEKYRLNDAFCSQAYGVLTTPIIPPVDCLQVGKPAKNLPQSQLDLCMSSS